MAKCPKKSSVTVSGLGIRGGQLSTGLRLGHETVQTFCCAELLFM